MVRTSAHAPRPVGSILALTNTGQLAGSVSGGCVEDELLHRARHQPDFFARVQHLRFADDPQASARVHLPCGGWMELVLEPLSERSDLRGWIADIKTGQSVRRRLSLMEGTVERAFCADEDRVDFDRRWLEVVCGSSHRLLLVGAGQLSQALYDLTLAFDYRMAVCDPREQVRAAWGERARAQLSTEQPDDFIRRLQPDDRTAIVVLSHDPKLDDLALIEALPSPAFYVGALGSVRSQQQRRERLLEFGLTPNQLDRLRGPIGLDIGALTPAEIAVSILAEMTLIRRQSKPRPPVYRHSG